MEDNFNDDESFLRAVYPADKHPTFWKNGKLASAAFIDPKGLSVNRTGDRTIIHSVNHMKHSFKGYIVSLTVHYCNQLNTFLIYRPSKKNIYHSEIHGSTTAVELDDIQALLMSKRAKIEYEPEIKIYKA